MALVAQQEIVCVRVSCSCPFAAEWLFYPKDIEGFHQTDAHDPRAAVGSAWDKNGCQGAISSHSCDGKKCEPLGRVVEVMADCQTCPYFNPCPFEPLRPK